MRQSAALFAFTLCTVSLAAQPILDATFVAATEMVVESRNFAFGGQRRVVPINTDLTAGLDLDTQVGAVARTRVRYRHDVDAVFAEIKDSGSCGWVSSSRCGQHDTLLRVSARQPTRVKLIASTLTAANASYGASSGWFGRIDIGNNGTFEVDSTTSPAVSTFEFTLDASGVAIRTTSFGSGSAGDCACGASYEGSLTLEVVPVDHPVVEVIASSPILVTSFFGTVSLRQGTGLRPSATLASAGTVWTSNVEATDDRVLVSLGETLAPIVAPGSTGPHQVLVTHRSPITMTVRVALAIDARCSTAPCNWSGRIDVGDDGIFELQSLMGRTVTHEVLATVGAAGLRIRVYSGGSANENTTTSGRLTISITPAMRCAVTAYGPTCGPGLRGVLAFQDVIDLRLDRGRPDTLGKLLLGVSPIDQPLPFSPCRILVDPMIAIPFPTDSAGQGRHRLRVPPGVLPMFVAQDLVLVSVAPFALEATHGLAVICQ